MRRRFGFSMLFAGAAFAVTATAGEIGIRTYRSDDTLLRIGPYAFEGGKTLNLTVGIGSSAFRHPTTRRT